MGKQRPEVESARSPLAMYRPEAESAKNRNGSANFNTSAQHGVPFTCCNIIVSSLPGTEEYMLGIYTGTNVFICVCVHNMKGMFKVPVLLRPQIEGNDSPPPVPH